MQDGTYSDHRRREPSPMAAGIVGAAIGATIGVVVAVIMTDPEKRKKMEKRFQDMQKWGNKTLEDLKHTSLESQDELKDIVADKTARVQKEIDEAAAQAQHRAK